MHTGKLVFHQHTRRTEHFSCILHINQKFTKYLQGITQILRVRI